MHKEVNIINSSQELNITSIYNPKKNPYISRNIGIEAAKGEFLAFLDAKCQPVSGWLQNGIKALEKFDQTIVAGKYEVVPYSSKLVDLTYGLLYLNNEKNVRRNYGVTTGNLFVRKKSFTEIGLFLTENISGNDIEWTERAVREKGYKLIYEPSAAVIYPGQPYQELITSVTKYAKGIVSFQKNRKRSMFGHLINVCKYLLPMRFSNFKNSLRYRKLNDLSTKDKGVLWFKIWGVKTQIARHYFKALIN